MSIQNLRLKFIEDVRKMRDTLISTVVEIDAFKSEINGAEMPDLARLRAEVISLEENLRIQQNLILKVNINNLYSVTR